ncbi:MAG: LLM class flavin-dependent oxidoreductase [Thaumarchaeota archaeon]|nr:LLM class flavin-dependent oxidoreductase [Nitrososphaerota archaeon]
METSKFRSVDVGFAELDARDHVRLAKKAEKLGFSCVWLQEGNKWGAIPLAAAILSNTEKIRVGTGIVSPFRRHPLSLSVDSAVLSELSGGRFILGIGSAPSQLRAMGLHVSQLRGLRESVEILRRLFKGERFVYSGEVFRIEKPTALEVALKSFPPIYLGALMPKMIELAAEIADGLLISRRGGSSPRYVKEVIRLVKKVRRRASHPEHFSIRAFIETSIDEDREKAFQLSRKVLGSYTIPLMPRPVLNQTEFWEDVRLIAGSREVSEKMIDEGIIRGFSMSGNPSDCLEKLETFSETGLEVPIFYFHGPSADKALELAGKQILPKVIS